MQRSEKSKIVGGPLLRLILSWTMMIRQQSKAVAAEAQNNDAPPYCRRLAPRHFLCFLHLRPQERDIAVLVACVSIPGIP